MDRAGSEMDINDLKACHFGKIDCHKRGNYIKIKKKFVKTAFSQIGKKREKEMKEIEKKGTKVLSGNAFVYG